jgi:predicted oxidoreductase
VRELVREDGRVAGAVVDDGAVRLVRARETVVCAGGFANAPHLLSQHVPALDRIERVLCGGWRSARGLGFELLSDAGAAFAALDRVWMYPVGTPNPADSSGRRGLVVRGLEDEIWVDRSGRRFHDETLRGGRSGIAALLAREGQTCWGVCDVDEAANLRLLDDERYGTALGSTAAQQAAFFAQSAHAWYDEPLGALAVRHGLPAAALSETVRAYNGHVAAGVDPDHGRDLRDARAIDASRACVIQYFPIVQKNLGGVLTDGDGRVLGAEGQPIPGLLAAGEVAGMAGGHLNGNGALEGTMFGPSLFAGRIAGRTAALQPARA